MRVTTTSFGVRLFVAVMPAAALVGVIAVMWPRSVLLAMGGMAAAAVALHDLAAGIAVFGFASFFEGLPKLGGELTFDKVFGAVLALCWLAVSLRRRDRSLLAVQRWPFAVQSAAFLLAWAFAACLWAVDAGAAMEGALRLTMVASIFFIAYTATTEPRHVRWVLVAFVVGATFSGLLGMAMWLAGSAPLGSPRLSGGVQDPNELAADLIPGLIFGVFLSLGARSRLTRGLLLAAVVVCALALLGTGSRGAIVALLASLLLAILVSPLAPRRLATVVLGVIVAATAYYWLWAPSEVVERLLSLTTGADSGRLDLWRIALAVIADRPFLGAGLLNFQILEPIYAAGLVANLSNPELLVNAPQVVHNTYLEVWAELGVFGFIGFMGAIVGSLYQAWRAAQRFSGSQDEEMQLAARGLMIGVAGLLAAYFFISGHLQEQLWLLLGVSSALGLLDSVSRPTKGEAAGRGRHSVPALEEP